MESGARVKREGLVRGMARGGVARVQSSNFPNENSGIPATDDSAISRVHDCGSVPVLNNGCDVAEAAECCHEGRCFVNIANERTDNNATTHRVQHRRT